MDVFYIVRCGAHVIIISRRPAYNAVGLPTSARQYNYL